MVQLRRVGAASASSLRPEAAARGARVAALAAAEAAGESHSNLLHTYSRLQGMFICRSRCMSHLSTVSAISSRCFNSSIARSPFISECLYFLQFRFMKQAGEGADYQEGCEGSRSQRCFKCGAIGHWAAECRGLEVQMLYSHVLCLSSRLCFAEPKVVRSGSCQRHAQRACCFCRRTERRGRRCR